MNKLTRTQKDKLQQFKTITGASERVAQSCLHAASWIVEAAIDHFYSSSPEPAPAPASYNSRRQNIEALFDSLKDPHQDALLVDGITQLCSELEIDPADIAMLVISWHFNATAMGEYSRSEFVSGMDALDCDSTAKLKRKLPQLRSEFDNPRKCKELWDYAYMFAREKGQKCVQLDSAIAMWQILFTRIRWPLSDSWCTFVQTHHKRAVSKDTWTQLLDFIRTIKPDLSNFDPDMSAWPYLIDEFVEHLRKERAQSCSQL